MRLFLKIPEFPSGTYAPNDRRGDFPLDKFSKSLNLDIDNLNRLINEWNELVEEEDKKELLLEIYIYYRIIISKYPDWVIATVPEIHEDGLVNIFSAGGFKEIEAQFAALGLTSIDSTSIHTLDEEYNAASSQYNEIRDLFYNYLNQSDLSSFPESIQKILGETYTFEIERLIESLGSSEPEEQYKYLTELKRIIRDCLATQDLKISQKVSYREFVRLINSGLRFLTEANANLGPTVLADTLLSPLFANMDPEKVTELVQILSEITFNPSALPDLYVLGEKGRNDYQLFLQDYSIECLGGGINTKNFRLRSLRGDKDFVLRVEKRMPAPMALSDRLAASVLRDVIVPMEWRQATINSPASLHPITTYLVLTPFYEEGDLFNRLSILPHTTEVELNHVQDEAIHFYQEMAVIFNKILDGNAAFTDPKNSNWLMHEGHLKLVDTKGFLPAPDGRLKWKGDERSWYPRQTIFSRHMLAPEFKPALRTQESIDVDKMHAFCLGINLYQFLKKCGDNDFIKTNGCVKDAQQLSFLNPIFQSPRGLHLKWLIMHLVQEFPQNRISIKEAIERFEKIKHLNLEDINALIPQKEICLELRKQIIEFRTDNDPGDNKYLEAVIEKIETETEGKSLTELEKELNEKLEGIKEKNKSKVIDLLNDSEHYNLSPEFRADIDRYRMIIPHSTNQKEIKRIYNQLRIGLAPIKNQAYLEDCSRCFGICRNLLDELNHFHSIGNEQDNLMQELIKDSKKSLITSRYNLNNLRALQNHLERINRSVTSVSMRAIRDVVGELRQKHSTKKNAKADNIEESLRTIPPEERRSAFFQPQVREALAHRHGPIHKGIPRNPDGSINEKDAAKSFKKVNERIRREPDGSLEPPSSGSSPPTS